jgi:hypothetical protein
VDAELHDAVDSIRAVHESSSPRGAEEADDSSPDAGPWTGGKGGADE